MTGLAYGARTVFHRYIFVLCDACAIVTGTYFVLCLMSVGPSHREYVEGVW